jgi:hypothetical protein
MFLRIRLKGDSEDDKRNEAGNVFHGCIHAEQAPFTLWHGV